jgi:hypothetical protein
MQRFSIDGTTGEQQLISGIFSVLNNYESAHKNIVYPDAPLTVLGTLSVEF